jgi:hypothetical protein
MFLRNQRPSSRCGGVKGWATAWLVLLALVASCRSDSRGPLRIMYVTIWADSLNTVFEQIGREWARARHDSVEFLPVGLNDLPQRTAEFVQVPNRASVALIQSTQAIINSALLLPMNGIVEHLAAGGHTPAPVARAMNMVDSVWVGAPIFSWSHVWVWRRDLVEKTHLAYPDSLRRVLPVLEALSRVQPSTAGFGIGLGRDDDSRMFILSILWSFGGAVFDSSGRVSLATEPAVKMIEFMQTLKRTGVLPAGVETWDGAANNRAFLAGQIAATVNSPTILYASEQSNPALASKIEHTLYPLGPAGRHTFATGFSLVVRRDHPQRDRAVSLIEWYLRPDNYGRLISAGRGSVNPQFSGFDTLAIWSDARRRVGLASMQFEHSVGWPGPVTKLAAEVFDRYVLNDMVAEALRGVKPEVAVEHARLQMLQMASRLGDPSALQK